MDGRTPVKSPDIGPQSVPEHRMCINRGFVFQHNDRMSGYTSSFIDLERWPLSKRALSRRRRCDADRANGVDRLLDSLKTQRASRSPPVTFPVLLSAPGTRITSGSMYRR